MQSRIPRAISAALFLVALPGCIKSCAPKIVTPAATVRVFFANLQDGADVTSPFLVQFGVEGMKIRPAGEDVMEQTSGHHHILIDNSLGFIEKGQVIPMDDLNRHYGKGQTESSVTLSPGPHTLSLQFGDGAHRSYGKDLAATIKVVVK